MARTDTLGNFLTDVADAIRTKKGSSDTILASDFDTEIENLPSGGGVVEATEKDVNFYDHTGFRWYSYTKSEFLALESMPANPEIEGLTAQGWNWSFTDAQDYVTRYGRLDIGQMYITDDGATRLYILLDKEWLSSNIKLGLNGNVEIDWGDNSQQETMSGTSINSNYYKYHTYTKKGAYIISIYPQSNTEIAIKQNFFGTCLIGLKKIEFGTSVSSLEPSCFNGLRGLSEICLPNTITSIPNNCFTNCRGLRCLIVPNTVTLIGTNTFQDVGGTMRFISSNSITMFGSQMFKWTFGMPNIYIPSNPQLTSLPTSLFYSCHTITSLIFPKNITTINNIFSDCPSIKYLDFSGYESIPSMSTNSFSGLSVLGHIIVPDDLYEDWIVASNWSTYASKIIKKSDYDNL